MSSDDKSFLGIGWSFPPQFELGSYSVMMTAEEENIRESIRIILNTNQRTRIFLSNFGAGLNRYVFGSYRLSMKGELENAIYEALERWEPRITVESVEVDGSRSGDGFLDITIDYFVIQTNHRRNYVIPFAFLEGTSLEKTHA